MKKGLIIGLCSIIILIIIAGYIHSPSKIVSDNKTCIKAGEIYQSPAVLGKKNGECCNGLIDIAQMAETDCDESGNSNLAGGNSICSACGNAICESWENRCNCREDCLVNRTEEQPCTKNDDCKSGFECGWGVCLKECPIGYQRYNKTLCGPGV